MIDLDDLDERPVGAPGSARRAPDARPRRASRATLFSSRRARGRRYTGDQQFGPAPVVQPDRVGEWVSVTFDVLHRPTVLEHLRAQHVGVVLAGGVRVVAHPAHEPHLPVVGTDSLPRRSDKSDGLDGLQLGDDLGVEPGLDRAEHRTGLRRALLGQRDGRCRAPRLRPRWRRRCRPSRAPRRRTGGPSSSPRARSRSAAGDGSTRSCPR